MQMVNFFRNGRFHKENILKKIVRGHQRENYKIERGRQREKS